MGRNNETSASHGKLPQKSDKIYKFYNRPSSLSNDYEISTRKNRLPVGLSRPFAV